ncbi:type I restriction enzyme, S subunit [Pseudomonas benzenivorans]|nr:restriction endonuclease subunit S [Pseudomonas benzenivorans]SDI06100.1 type I restriction enzyme, S subunit [Pseudomonas benzenivorans]
MSFPRYPEYKDSGVEWLGAVPGHWAVTPIKQLGKLKGGAGFPHAEQGLEDEEITFHKVNALARAGSDDVLVPSENSISRSTATQLGAYIFPPGSIVFAKVGAALLLGRIRMLGVEACIDNNMMGLNVFSSEHHVGFVKYAMSLVRFDLISNPGAVPSLNESQIGNFPLAVPPYQEQRSISSFLDYETAKIDGLMAEQEKLIALLKEKRQAVIAHAVTKGLDPAVPLKDSGVEWLGEVPAHWHVMPIRLAAKLESGHTPSRSRPEYWDDCYIPWMTLADVWQIRRGKADYIYETKETVSDLGLANSSARLLPKGTVVLSRTASVGFSAIMGVDMATTQDFANWVCGDKLIPEFLLFVLRSMEGEFRRLMMGSTHNTIYMPDIQAFRFVLPSLEEQRQIIEHCQRFSVEFDELIDEAQRGIDLLKERRTALISAAVTGQIDVRGLIKDEQEQAA